MAGFQLSTNGRIWVSTEDNARPQWLADAHAALDAAVAGAYGWAADITDDDAVRELLNLNGGRQT